MKGRIKSFLAGVLSIAMIATSVLACGGLTVHAEEEGGAPGPGENNNGKIRITCQAQTIVGGKLSYRIGDEGDFHYLDDTDNNTYVNVNLPAEDCNGQDIYFKLEHNEGYRVDTTRGVNMWINGSQTPVSLTETEEGSGIYKYTFGENTTTSAYDLEFGWESAQGGGGEGGGPGGEGGPEGEGNGDAGDAIKPASDYTGEEKTSTWHIVQPYEDILLKLEAEEGHEIDKDSVDREASYIKLVDPAENTEINIGFGSDDDVAKLLAGECGFPYNMDAPTDICIVLVPGEGINVQEPGEPGEIPDGQFGVRLLNAEMQNENEDAPGGEIAFLSYSIDGGKTWCRIENRRDGTNVEVRFNNRIVMNGKGIIVGDGFDPEIHNEGTITYNLSADGKVDFQFDCNISERYYYININGVDYSNKIPSTTEDIMSAVAANGNSQTSSVWIEGVEPSEDYVIVARKKEIGDDDKEYMPFGNFLWDYDKENSTWDNYVGGGLLSFKSLKYNGEVYDSIEAVKSIPGCNWEEGSREEKDDQGHLKRGEAVLPAGSELTIALIPDAGNQLVKLGLNGFAFKTGDAIGEYTFTIAHGNFHLEASFEAVADVVATDEKSNVAAGSISLGEGEVSMGSAMLSVAETTATDAEISGFAGAVKDVKVEEVLDLNLSQIVYKGSETEYWATEMNDLSKEAEISLTLDKAPESDTVKIVHQKHDGTYEEIPATYDAKTKQLTFKTSSFSKYAIAIPDEKLGTSTKVEERFADVASNKWYVTAIQYMVDKGLMKGVSSSTFEPETPCTREMFVTILYRAAGSPSVEGLKETGFTDVPDGKWFSDAIKWAYNIGLTTGVSKTEFGLGKLMERQQAAVFLMRYAGIIQKDTTKRGDIAEYPDVDKVSGYAKDAMQWANAYGIVKGKAIGGKNYLDPTASASRAEMAKMVNNFVEVFGDIMK